MRPQLLTAVHSILVFGDALLPARGYSLAHRSLAPSKRSRRRRQSALDAVDEPAAMAPKPEPWAASVVVATAGVGLAVRPDLRLPICLLLIAVLLSPPGVASIVDVHATFMGATLERPRVHMAFRDIMRRGMGDAITDQKVKEALNANIKEAVADALRDPEFTLIARETVKDALRDRDVHRAALEGAMGNLSVKLNPFRRNDEAASPRGRADSESGARSPPPPA